LNTGLARFSKVVELYLLHNIITPPS